MKKRSGWIKRKLLNIEFKGRAPRALLWRKWVYEEWFYCARLAKQAGKKVPTEFGSLDKFDIFEEWWRHPDFGFELFCEPYVGNFAEIVNGKALLLPDEVLLKINVNGDPDLILRDIKSALRSKFDAEEYHSRARFKPSRPMKYLRKEAVRLSRLVWELTEQNQTQAEIVETLNLAKNGSIEAHESAVRKVQRAKQRFKSSLQNVGSSTFP